ncbi:MAG: ABC-2 family transporter protein [Bacteriovoracaceae bacterium]|nr:ABC-2 family transporter protein [Bacteriovoracaceae bacterium]
MLKKYSRIYWQFLRISFSKAASFRFDFYFRTIMDIFYYASIILFFDVIYGHTATLGGWNQSQMHIFLASYFVLDSLDMTIFSTNLWWLPLHINRGDLDLYLTKPINSLFYLGLKEFQVGSLINVFFSYALFLYFWLSSQVGLTFLDLMIHHLLLINALFLFNFVRIFFIISAFWSGSPRGIDELFIGFTRFLNYPEQIYPNWLRKIMVSIIPFSFMISIPHQIIFGQKSVIWIFISIAVTLFFGWLATCLWKMGLSKYSSASS